MKKNLLKSREDFIELKNYYKNKVYDAVGFVAEDEDEPNEYPCVMVSRHEPYDEDFSYLIYAIILSIKATLRHRNCSNIKQNN